MKATHSIYLGIDCGATTSKVGGVAMDGEPVSLALRQSSTRSADGAQAMVDGWMRGAHEFLEAESLDWEAVAGVGLAMPGPYLGYGVLGRMPNMPESLAGWRFLDDLSTAIEQAAGRAIPTVTANDGQLAGLAEAWLIQKDSGGGVVMLAPGSGLGCSHVDADGRLLSGDHDAAAILCHMPAPFHLLGLPKFRCGCGRDWGCFEAYTSISGLTQYLDHLLPRYPEHPLGKQGPVTKESALALRGLAQEDDPLALEIFDLQATAMGHAVATACMAYDSSHVVIGGGLIDPEATTPGFRKRYLGRIRSSAAEYSWIPIDQLAFHEASLGELSQTIGAALLARGRGQALPIDIG
jgi:glucokinase